MQVDEFLIEAVSLKELQKVRVGHDGTGPGAGWFLDKVVIQDPQDDTKEYSFPCGRYTGFSLVHLSFSCLLACFRPSSVLPSVLSSLLASFLPIPVVVMSVCIPICLCICICACIVCVAFTERVSVYLALWFKSTFEIPTFGSFFTRWLAKNEDDGLIVRDLCLGGTSLLNCK